LLPVIFIWITLVYMGSLDNGFVDWDDKAYILDNAMIRSLAPDHLLQMMVSLEPAYWHPVTWLSHAVDYQLFELNPAGHHFTSVLIHGVTVLWVFLLFRHVLSRACPAPGINLAILLGSAWAALMFGLHPLRVESVVWAAERKDLLCAFFMIPAMLTYLHYAEAQQPGARRRWYGITFLLFLLALMSKPMAVTLPVVMLILDGFPLRRWGGSCPHPVLDPGKGAIFCAEPGLRPRHHRGSGKCRRRGFHGSLESGEPDFERDRKRRLLYGKNPVALFPGGPVPVSRF